MNAEPEKGMRFMDHSQPLKKNAFVLVKPDGDFRAGQDGMVVSVGSDDTVGLLFGFDRHNRSPSQTGLTYTGLVEEWRLDELDLASVCH